MIRRSWAILTAGVLIGCSLEPTRLAGPEVDPLPRPTRTSYAIHLVYTSDLAEPYYVMSGPAQSYGRYTVNAQFEAILQAQVAQLSDPASDRQATLTVHLTELSTRYRRIGGSPPAPGPQGPLYAMLGQGSLAVPVAWEMAQGSYLLGREIDSDIPEEIRKGATLIANVELSGDGFTVLQQTVTAEHDDIITRWEFDPRQTYVYTDILDTTLRVAAAQITEIVVTHLR